MPLKLCEFKYGRWLKTVSFLLFVVLIMFVPGGGGGGGGGGGDDDNDNTCIQIQYAYLYNDLWPVCISERTTFLFFSNLLVYVM